MTNTYSNEIRIVIGSWGSYNECNERALGSRWLDLADYGDWDEIVEELERQGFELDGIDEELFIQDIDNFPSDATNWDYMHPQRLFEILHEAEVLDDSGKYDTLMAFLEVRGFREFEELVVVTVLTGTTTFISTRITIGTITVVRCSTAAGTRYPTVCWTFLILRPMESLSSTTVLRNTPRA
ncbi:MAG: antirestriction protein ArdA [Oscillospiraceae bacterium]|nr:antirestriction protein ArdA [Clostridia bacterium]MBP3698629.1 antirestriction protein ArdA [Oscillospiraceae bacterium]